MNEKTNFIKIYMDWLQENTREKKINSNTYRITFPFLDSNNTMTELYIVEKDHNTYLITDDGSTFGELDLIGFDFKSTRRKSIINNIINNHGVNISTDNELYIECTKETLAFKKHLLIQCILKISDLCQLSYSNIKTLFNEEVEKFLEENDVRFIKDIVLIGKSKLQSNYDFAIAKSKNAPERVIKLINNIDSTQVKSIIFSWEDVRDTRNADAKLITIINDTNKKVSVDNINAFNEYQIKPILWSESNRNIGLLTA
ncbi:MAG: DUF1829 domain-containing protein [Clostridium argentinense]|uniref:DUF1829 domain-containing protein n=1 Tax=Clostridium faecium TaxID=2762223 RepID=A0ABR8YWQ7_9CLOT|nr:MULTISPECIES: DUF1829 domain-containing protein [Clostridium]MBD8048428.1 DUF1829 domain-containing protein [Clostridium faecium]MBS5825100.1 DUF1829 domain-containing protein [Clostridium argentinense]